MITAARIAARVGITRRLPTQRGSGINCPCPATCLEPKIADIPIKKIATSPSRAVLLTKSAMIAITRTEGANQIGGAPTPPGFVRSMERTFPPGKGSPGSKRKREGWRINSKDHGAQTIIGAETIAIRRMLRSSKSFFVNTLGFLLKANTSRITRMNCQISRAPKVKGEKANTTVRRNASHQVFRQESDSRLSNPSKARTNHGPTTNKTTVPSRPEFSAASAKGANE